MTKYVGTKIVQAEPAYKFTGVKPGCRVPNQIGNEDTIALLEDSGWEIVDKREGYKVVYQGGYVSWSPKEVFEEAYRRTDGMSFGLALEAAKKGMRIARAGWNGKNQYVELGTDFQYTCAASDIPGSVGVQHTDIGSKALVFVGTCGSQVGWLASQADMLAEDWYIVEEAKAYGQSWAWAQEVMEAGGCVRRRAWKHAEFVSVVEEPAELRGKVCRVCDDSEIIPDWEPDPEDLQANDWDAVCVEV